jgi:hypothetical protein|tara:strand:- start:59 stop:1309 length:1251 start_codon:yes stop_codon:yes gene_type:complete
MSVNTQSNFQLIRFLIADYPPITVNQLLYVKYTEDIKAASMKMEVQLTDSETGFLSQLTGMENVFIQIGDSEGKTEIGGDFVIYDIQDRKNIGGKSSAVLMLCTADFLNNAANKISRRFGKGEGKKIHDVVKEEILIDLMGIAEDKLSNFEPCVNNFSFVSPYWNPFTAIRWLAAKAIPEVKGSGKNATAGYAFYQTRSGYNFVSYDSFAREEPVTRMVVGHEKEELEDDEDKNITPVDKVTIESSVDLLRGLNLGSYSSNVMTIDLKDMSFVEHPFNINKYYQDVATLNSGEVPEFYSGFDNNLTFTRIMSKVTDSALFTEGTYTQGFTKQLSQSSLREKLFYSKKVIVELVTDYSLEIGEVVQLDIYKGTRDREQDFANSGKYVIGKVERTFKSSQDKMTTKLTLYTDSDGVET